MSMRRRHVWTTLPILGLTIALNGCGGEILLTSALSIVGPRLLDAAIDTVSGDGGGSENSVDVLAVADRLKANGDYPNAALFYRRAHQADPESVEALAGLAQSLTSMGENTGAAEAYGRALVLEPEDPALLRGLGNVRILLAQPQFAVPQFEAALRANRRDVRSYNGLGVALDMTGDHQAAQKAYRAGLAIEPTSQTLLNNLGLSLALVGKEAEAVAMLEKVNEAPAATAVNRQNLALVYGLGGRYEAAERLARVDLDSSGVQQNLSYYVANQGNDTAPALASALGVELRGLQYARVAPSTTAPPGPAADDTSRMLASAPTSEDPAVVNNQDPGARSIDASGLEPFGTAIESAPSPMSDSEPPPPQAAPREPVMPAVLAELPATELPPAPPREPPLLPQVSAVPPSMPQPPSKPQEPPRAVIMPAVLAEPPAAAEPPPLPPAPPRDRALLAQAPAAAPTMPQPPGKPQAATLMLASQSVPPAIPDRRQLVQPAAIRSAPQPAPGAAVDEVDAIGSLSPIRADATPIEEPAGSVPPPSPAEQDQSAVVPALAPSAPRVAPAAAQQLAFVMSAAGGGVQLPEPFDLRLSPSPTVTQAMGGPHPAVIVNLDVLD